MAEGATIGKYKVLCPDVDSYRRYSGIGKSSKGDKDDRCVEVYTTDDGLQESFIVDGWFVQQRVTPDSDSPLYDQYVPYRTGFKKVPTSCPIIRPSFKHSTTEETEEAYRLQTTGIAEAALKYYNKKHHTDFKLVDPLASNCRLLPGGLWSHCNFTAKPEAAFLGGSEDASATKLFFAEENQVGRITACRILDGSSTTACGMCSGGLQHPKSRFRQGLYHPKHRDLRPRRQSLTGQRH